MGGRRGSSTLIRLLRSLLLSCAMLGVSALASAQASFNAEQSDLWWSPGEWGWGLQIFEQGDILFATLFVYDAGGHQTVFTAVLSQGAGTAWAGDLTQATTGPYFGSAAYDPELVRARKVGGMTFTKVNSGTAALVYSIDGVVVTKSMTRQLFRYDNYSGTYMATVYVVTSHCSDSKDDGERTGSYAIAINQIGAEIAIVASFARQGASVCTYHGDYAQAGQVAALGSSYTCSDGDEGSMNFFELTKRAGMFSGRLQGHSITDSCDYSGAMTGLIPR